MTCADCPEAKNFGCYLHFKNNFDKRLVRAIKNEDFVISLWQSYINLLYKYMKYSYEYKYSVNDIKIFVNIQSIDWRLRLNSVILILLISLQK